jgi:hypothetical protein
MKEQQTLITGVETFAFDTSLGIEAYAHHIFSELMKAGTGVLHQLTNLEEQKAGQDFRYVFPAASGGSRALKFEAKAELWPFNHFYELMLFYLDGNGEGRYEFGNAQKTTAQLMLYINYASRYVIIAQRATWMHVAQELVYDAVNKQGLPLFAALNGKTRLELAGVGRQFPHDAVIRKLLACASARKWPYLPFAVFDWRDELTPGGRSQTAADAEQRQNEYATTLMRLKYPSYAEPRNADRLQGEVERFRSLMKRGDTDYRRMENLLAKHGGIRPANSMAAWVEALPELGAQHELPVQRFGPELLQCALTRQLVTNQSETFIKQFNEARYLPRTQSSADYFHSGLALRQVGKCAFSMAKARAQ